MTKLRSLAQSLAGEARGPSKKLPGVRVAILVYDAEDSALAVVHDDASLNWDGVGQRLRAVAEELRVQQREVGTW